MLDAWQKTLDAAPDEPVPTPELDTFRGELLANLAAISTSIREVTWTPTPPRVITIAKNDSSSRRTLHLPTLVDRITERAVAAVLTRATDHRLQPDSYAYRPGLGTTDAIAALQHRIDAGNHWVVRTDIADCFGSLSRRGCLRAVTDMLDDPEPELLTLIASSIDNRPSPSAPATGIAQGSPLSPVLCNIYPDGLDQELWTHGTDTIRYADDIATAASTSDAAHEHLENIGAALQRRSLRPNTDKTGVHDARDGVRYLGVTHPARRTRMIVCNDRGVRGPVGDVEHRRFPAPKAPGVDDLEQSRVPVAGEPPLTSRSADTSDSVVAVIEERLQLLPRQWPVAGAAFVLAAMHHGVPFVEDLDGVNSEMALAYLVPPIARIGDVSAERGCGRLIQPNRRVRETRIDEVGSPFLESAGDQFHGYSLVKATSRLASCVRRSIVRLASMRERC